MSVFLGSGFGEPHFVTFDGKRFSFNGLEDYTLLEVLPEFSNVPVFTLQGRLKPGFAVSFHAELAFGKPDLAFHVSILHLN